jgi:hypothetical protein
LPELLELEKQKTIQVLSEQLSSFGIPVMMDIKGDFSGAKRGEENLYNGRHAKINIPYNVSKFPVELLTLSKQNGVRLRHRF